MFFEAINKKISGTLPHSCEWGGFSYLQYEGSWSSFHQQISFTSNSFQIYFLTCTLESQSSHTVRLRFSLTGNMSSDRSRSFRTKGLLFEKQRINMAGKVCLSEDMFEVCDHGWRNCWITVLKPTVLHFCCYTHLWAYTSNPLLKHVGTTCKGYSNCTTVLYFIIILYWWNELKPWACMYNLPLLPSTVESSYKNRVLRES